MVAGLGDGGRLAGLDCPGRSFGELAGLRCHRVHLDRSVPVLQVVEVRYQAGGQFGSGFKGRPKSDAGIRELPLAPLVVESIRRQLPPDADPEVLVLTGPGGGNGVPAGSRTMLSRYNFRRVYQRAVARAGHDLAAVDPHGPHDLRHTFSTWLEDAGIPARVIDELMGHQRSRHGELDGGSRIGARYRHTTDAMAVRVVEAIQERLTIALRVAQDAQADRQGTRRVF
jgi:integrase